MKKKEKFDNTTEENFLKNKSKRKKVSESFKTNGKTKKNLKIAGIVSAVIIGLILIILGVLYLWWKYGIGEQTDSNGGITTDENIADRPLIAGSDKEEAIYKYYTFLATATDNGGNLTDVIMVARFDYEDSKVSVLQIPRDTYVKVSSNLYFNDDGTLSKKNFDPSGNTYETKINSVYAHGKNLCSSYVDSLLKETDGKSESEIENICKSKNYKFLNVDTDKVKKYSKTSDNAEKKQIKANIKKDFGITYLSTLIYHYFGIPIDYQAQVNLNGFRGIVDAVGGVDLEVPGRMYYVDKYQDLYIDLYPGYQHLDGKKAEGFVRYRRYVGGDVDRLKAQKIFLDAFMKKLTSPTIVTKIDDIVGVINENLYTSISFTDMLRFAKKVISMDLSEDISISPLPGVGEYVGNVSYYIAYKDDALNLINEKFNVYNNAKESKDLDMIDYNDVVQGKKPAVSTSTVPTPTGSDNSGDNSDTPQASDNSGNDNIIDIIETDNTENGDDFDFENESDISDNNSSFDDDDFYGEEFTEAPFNEDDNESGDFSLPTDDNETDSNETDNDTWNDVSNEDNISDSGENDDNSVNIPILGNDDENEPADNYEPIAA